MTDRRRALEEMTRVARAAARLVLERYAGELRVEYKGQDDPVTALDRAANALVCEELARAFPGVPVVAEESDPSSWAARAGPEAFFVDPVDGTRELILRNGEFSVMIGLAEGGRATAGVVAWPTEARTFVGADGEGAHELATDGSRRALRVVEPRSPAEAIAVVSRSHPDPATAELLARSGFGRVVPLGSAGLKVVRVATGEAHAYVHLAGGGKLWDACGPEAILAAAGGALTDRHGRPLDYRGPLALDGVIAATPRARAWLRK